MQGMITFDFGNSHPHAGIFHKNSSQWDLIKVVPFKELPIALDQLKMDSSNSSIVVCEVKSYEEELKPYIEQGYLLTRVKDYWRGAKFAGMPVHYAKSLGEDRLIEAYYVFKKLKANALIIDAGTYTTMDVVTQDGFKGGYIIPNLSDYLSLYKKAEKLKDIQLSFAHSRELPQESHLAMSESYSAFAAMAKSLIASHHLEKVLLTGGKQDLWKNIFKDTSAALVVESSPSLIHLALHYWMTTQIEPL